jgi:hypothetical protein
LLSHPDVVPTVPNARTNPAGIFLRATPSQPSSLCYPKHLGFEQRICLLCEPDNLRSGVSKPSRHEPGVNPTNHDLAEYYDVAVLPARACRAKYSVFHHRGIARTVQKGLCGPGRPRSSWRYRQIRVCQVPACEEARRACHQKEIGKKLRKLAA